MAAWFSGIEAASVTIIDRALTSLNASTTHHFFDIGANQGFYSAVAGLRDYRAIGVEVQPTCAEQFSCTAWWNGYHQHQLWNRYAAENLDVETGRTIMIDEAVCSGHTNVAQGKNEKYNPRGKMVPIRPLDVGRMIEDANLQVAAMKVWENDLQPFDNFQAHLTHSTVTIPKIDTEGYEANIFRSLRPLLARRAIPNILVEIGPKGWEKFGVPMHEALELFRQMYEEWGMTAYRVEIVPPETPVPLDLASYVKHLPTFADYEAEIRDLWVCDFWFTLDAQPILDARP
ncbi:hypothetical protein HDU93_001848, partial [Gonapodya sp. JEL0774]